MIPTNKTPIPTRALCKLCLTIAESYFETDRGTCKCGEISVKGGLMPVYRDTTGNLSNMSIINNDTNTPSVEGKSGQNTAIEDQVPNESHYSRSRQDRLYELKRLIESDINLPKHEHYEPVRRVDLVNYMVIILELLKLPEKEGT